MSVSGPASASIRSASRLLLLSLVAPPLLLHGWKLLLVQLFPLFDVSTMRALLGWSMPIGYLFLATPLSLLALPGAIRLLHALPEPPSVALSLRTLALLFFVLTAGATAARFQAELTTAAALQDGAGVAKLALCGGVALALLRGRARAPRLLLLSTAVFFGAALLLHGLHALWGAPSPRWLVVVRGGGAALLAVSLLLVGRRSGRALGVEAAG
ncbi:MAG: hypothetical protein MUF64_32935 [Polyangiaceae bacterium]|jgi:hypothetical protein|nr:hypothetical protein [Polyangiaceae bacterium]